MISPHAWAVLQQLKLYGRAWDGDLISKAGRNELVKGGLVRRVRIEDSRISVNELTEEGARVAASCIEPDRALVH